MMQALGSVYQQQGMNGVLKVFGIVIGATVSMFLGGMLGASIGGLFGGLIGAFVIGFGTIAILAGMMYGGGGGRPQG